MGQMARLRALEAKESAFLGFGRVWFVDAKRGSDSSNGLSAAAPFLTMAKAFANVDSGDTIIFRGKVKEQLTTPVGVFDVSILGSSNNPRHADDHSETASRGRGSSGSTWAAPAAPVAATPLLKILQQGWKTKNFIFAAPADAAAVQIFRDGGAGDLERDGSHYWADNMRFDGGQNHIEQSGGCAFVRIENSLFRGATAQSIKDTAGAGIGTLLCWRIIGNTFQDNVSHIIAALRQGTVRDNAFGKFTTFALDLSNGLNNAIYANAFSGTFSIVGGYKGVASDEWGGNYNVIAGGVTNADPA